jgi:hypothetical protein
MPHTIDNTALERKLTKALADAEFAKRRATMALRMAKDAIRWTLCTPKTAAMIREAEEELKRE